VTYEPVAPGRSLKGVAIGAGYFAPFHYEAWSRIPTVAITGVAARDRAKAERIVEEFGVQTAYTDWRRMLEVEKPDFVDIITPPDTHEEMCAFAAERGIHIVCQKPLAPTIDAGVRIVETVERAGVRFMVHENWRWQPWYRAIKRVQAERTIGGFTHLAFTTRLGDGWGPDAYLARQPFFRDYKRLLIYETGVHFIDMFRYLCGEVTSVFASLRRLNPVIQGEDAGELHLTFGSGATALWDANRYNETEAAMPRYTFGQMRVDGDGGHMFLDADAYIRVKPLGKPGYFLDYVREPKNFAGDCVYALQRHFVDCLRNGTEFESNGRDYLRTVAVVEAAYKSANDGQVVRLPEAKDVC
jgi:D-apiose dehydrogenase